MHLVEDFLDDDGNEIPHPASGLASDVAALARYYKVLDDLETEIKTTLTDLCQADPLDELGTARIVWERVASSARFAWLSDGIQEVEGALVDKLGEPGCKKTEAMALSN